MTHKQAPHGGVPGGEGAGGQHLGVHDGRPHQRRRLRRLDEIDQSRQPRHQFLALRRDPRTALAGMHLPGARHSDLLQAHPAAGRQGADDVAVQRRQQRARRGDHRPSPAHQVRHPAHQASPGAPQSGHGVQARVSGGGLGEGASDHLLAQHLGGDHRALDAARGDGAPDRGLGAGLAPPAPQSLVPAQLGAGLTHRGLGGAHPLIGGHGPERLQRGILGRGGAVGGGPGRRASAGPTDIQPVGRHAGPTRHAPRHGPPGPPGSPGLRRTDPHRHSHHAPNCGTPRSSPTTDALRRPLAPYPEETSMRRAHPLDSIR